MTKEQEVAITNPCIRAEETANQRFHWWLGLWSIVLTCGRQQHVRRRILQLRRHRGLTAPTMVQYR